MKQTELSRQAFEEAQEIDQWAKDIKNPFLRALFKLLIEFIKQKLFGALKKAKDNAVKSVGVDVVEDDSNFYR